MICPKCGRRISSSDNYATCSVCKTAVRTYCPLCGFYHASQNAYCHIYRFRLEDYFAYEKAITQAFNEKIWPKLFWRASGALFFWDLIILILYTFVMISTHPDISLILGATFALLIMITLIFFVNKSNMLAKWQFQSRQLFCDNPKLTKETSQAVDTFIQGYIKNKTP